MDHWPPFTSSIDLAQSRRRILHSQPTGGPERFVIYIPSNWFHSARQTRNEKFQPLGRCISLAHGQKLSLFQVSFTSKTKKGSSEPRWASFHSKVTSGKFKSVSSDAHRYPHYTHRRGEANVILKFAITMSTQQRSSTLPLSVFSQDNSWIWRGFT